MIFIFEGDKAWVPLETTLVQQGFLKATSTGAKQWRDAQRLDVAGFFPIHDAWQFYEPVSFAGGTLSILFSGPGRYYKQLYKQPRCLCLPGNQGEG